MIVNHEYFMQLAILEAKKAAELGDVPIGAVIVKGDDVIATGYNQKMSINDTTKHAEIIAIGNASAKLNDWRLNGTTIYVTAEPCIMCSGAILHARIDRVIFGVTEDKFGGVVSHANILDIRTLNHRVEWLSGICRDEIAEMMKGFFLKLRDY